MECASTTEFGCTMYDLREFEAWNALFCHWQTNEGHGFFLLFQRNWRSENVEILCCAENHVAKYAHGVYKCDVYVQRAHNLANGERSGESARWHCDLSNYACVCERQCESAVEKSPYLVVQVKLSNPALSSTSICACVRVSNNDIQIY